MDSRKYDRFIRIEAPSLVDTDYGPQPGPWTPFKTMRAEVQEVLPSKGESATEGIRIAERPARVRTRYVEGVTGAMRVVYLDRGDRLMKITSPPVEIGRREALEFMVADFSTSGEGS